MPEIMKKPNGDIDFQKLFMGLAMALVIIIQQVQVYNVANIKANAEADKYKFMTRTDIDKGFEKIRKLYVEEELITKSLERINRRLDRLEGAK